MQRRARSARRRRSSPEAIALADRRTRTTRCSCVDKPAGLVVHPGARQLGRHAAERAAAPRAAACGVPRAGIVHRLDKDTSGLLVVAKTLTAQTALVRQLQARTRDARIPRARRGRHRARRHRRRADRPASDAAHDDGGRRHRASRRARTTTSLERFGVATLLRCRLETGRTHQIRVHLASLGHPLVGDPAYGRSADRSRFARQALHAARLALVHPVDRRACAWESPLPADFAGRCSPALRGASAAVIGATARRHRSRDASSPPQGSTGSCPTGRCRAGVGALVDDAQRRRQRRAARDDEPRAQRRRRSTDALAENRRRLAAFLPGAAALARTGARRRRRDPDASDRAAGAAGRRRGGHARARRRLRGPDRRLPAGALRRSPRHARSASRMRAGAGSPPACSKRRSPRSAISARDRERPRRVARAGDRPGRLRSRRRRPRRLLRATIRRRRPHFAPQRAGQVARRSLRRSRGGASRAMRRARGRRRRLLHA